jgi:hypothetical protein
LRQLVHDARESLNSIALNSDLLLRVLPGEGDPGVDRARTAAMRIRHAAYRLADRLEALFEKSAPFDPAVVLREFAEAAGATLDPAGPPEGALAAGGGEETLRASLEAGRERAARTGGGLRLCLEIGRGAALVTVEERDGEGGVGAVSTLWLPVEKVT